MTILLKPRKSIKDEKYKAWIRRLPCLLCGGESEPHHIPQEGHGVMARKTDDLRAIPLCHSHHMQYHRYGRESFQNYYNLDYEYVIQELNRIWSERQAV